MAGIVFNRARIKDIERSGYASYIASQRMSPREAADANGQGDSKGDLRRRLGPIADALAIPLKREEDS